MPAGDASRTWFPEMVEALRRERTPDMPIDAIVGLSWRLDKQLQQIRSERNISPPTFRCPKCSNRGASAPTHVSVRGLILALSRFEIASLDLVKDVERRWNKHRKQRTLDAYGKKSQNQSM